MPAVNLKIDLHSHTRHSDGYLTPTELVARAQTMQIDVLAITDHDTVAGIDEAMHYQSSQKRPMQIIPGIELSTSWHGFDIHIVGLNLDHDSAELLDRLALQKAARNQRAQKIAIKLEKAGIADTFADASRLAGEGQITRSHFARVIMDRGLVSDQQAAFDKYLGKGKRAHVSPQWISIEQAVSWIRMLEVKQCWPILVIMA